MPGISNESIVVELAFKAKEAARYFDRVVPLYFPLPTEQQKVRDAKGNVVSIRDLELLPVEDLLPPSMYNCSRVPHCAQDYVDVILRFFKLIDPKDHAALQDNARAFWECAAQVRAKHAELQNAPLLLPSRDFAQGADTGQTALLTLSGLSLINPEKASWDLIKAVRKDAESKKKLRRLRLDVIKQYHGKERRFIEDDLCQRLEDYQKAVRDWGFETRVATLSNLLSSKALLGAAGGATLSALFGEPWVALASAAGGVAIEIGKISIDLAKRRYSLTQFRRDHPLGYIISTREELKLDQGAESA